MKTYNEMINYLVNNIRNKTIKYQRTGAIQAIAHVYGLDEEKVREDVRALIKKK